MGQYYYPVNLSKWERLHPHQLGDGLKAREFSYGPTATILCALLTKGGERAGGDWPEERAPNGELVVGRWHSDRIVIVGDYAANGDVRVGGIPMAEMIWTLSTLDEVDLQKYYNELMERGETSAAKRLREALDRYGPVTNISQSAMEWYEMYGK